MITVSTPERVHVGRHTVCDVCNKQNLPMYRIGVKVGSDRERGYLICNNDRDEFCKTYMESA